MATNIEALSNNELTKLRGRIKAQLTRSETFIRKLTIDKLNNILMLELKCRISKIEQVWSEYDKIQSEIEMREGDISSEAQAEERDKFENTYYGVVALAESLIQQYHGTLDNKNNSNISMSKVQFNVKLPPVNIPVFDGTYENWHAFRDIYNTLIHSNDCITDIQKFYYLRMYLSKQASQVIESLEINSVNYKVAWELLNKRYENKRLTIYNHINALFSLSSLQKESLNALRELVDNLNKHMRALKNLDQPVDTWDSLIIYLISNKLDPVTRREWESSVANKSDLPTLDDFITFITQRCQLLDTCTTVWAKQTCSH